MPPFEGQISEEGLLQIIAYIKSSGQENGRWVMTTTQATLHEHYLNINYGIKSWLFTTDHKRIALLYLTSITLFFFLGAAAAVLMRLELLIPPGI
jgi:hypothetical protein